MNETVVRGLRAAALTGTFVFASHLALAAETPIKLGVLEDQSGDFAAATIGKVHAIQLAADEINKAGGIMGRPLELVTYDTQSDNTRYQEFMRRVLQRDKVDVVFAGFSSASREAYRPIVDQLNGFAFYNNQYEGGVCDGHMIVTGAVPEQQFSTLIPYMMQIYGKKVYTLAADYNFGQISAEWVRKIVKENGGEMAGEEFIPLGVSQFSQSIQNIQKAKPDFVVTLLVGTAQASYYEQAASANVNLPMASSVNVGQGYEHKRFKPPSLANMHNAIQYQLEVPTARNRAFVKRWMQMFPDDQYIGEMAQNTYFTIHLYAKAARLAGTTDQPTVKKCLELGWNIEAPEGSVFLEPGTHHCAHPIRLAVADENHNVKFVRDWPMIQAWWLQRLGVNLVRNPEYKQYTPDEDPYFAMFGKKG
jgi:branched-chain amino acid transport system substrate-binding protein